MSRSFFLLIDLQCNHIDLRINQHFKKPYESVTGLIWLPPTPWLPLWPRPDSHPVPQSLWLHGVARMFTLSSPSPRTCCSFCWNHVLAPALVFALRTISHVTSSRMDKGHLLWRPIAPGNLSCYRIVIRHHACLFLHSESLMLPSSLFF